MDFRHEIVRLSYEEQYSEREIARRLHLPRSTVHYWLVRSGLRATTKSGRPRVTDPQLDTRLFVECSRNPFVSAVDLQRNFASHCSVSTVRNRLREKGLKCRVPARKPYLTPFHKQMRFSFAASKLEWPRAQWEQVVFSDEKIFRASTRGALRVYRPRHGSHRFDEEYLAPNAAAQSRFTICVWLAFGGPGRVVREVHRVERPTLNAEYYTTRILPLVESAVNEHRLTFMQDLSSIHTSRMTTAWLQERNWRVMWDWPAKGPDMNPVENVWAELVRRIETARGEQRCRNRDELWEDVQAAFASLPESYFFPLLDSMPRRVRTVFDRRGGWTKY